MKFLKIISVLFFVLFSSFPVYARQDVLVCPLPGRLDQTHDYVLKLLKHSIKITNDKYGPLEIANASYESNSISRRIRQVISGKTDVVWSVTSTKLEKMLIPVRIPLYKGVYGFRLFLIRKDDQARFNNVRTLKDLKPFIFGQAHDSDEIDVLDKAGLIVEKSSTYEGTFKMLAYKRFDCLPKSINEIFAELNQFGKQLINLKIEDNLVLYYHKPVYFFFKDKKLADRVEAGLELMLKDGSFDDYFNNKFKDLLVRANISKRKIFRIDISSINPESLPLARKKLWYNVVEGADQYGTVLNLSGKQRMLTQKMSKEMFLIALKTDVEDNIKSLKATSDLFEKTLTGLRDGSKELKLPATQNPIIVKELDGVRPLWQPFNNEIQKTIKTGVVTTKQVDIIDKINIPLLNQMNKCVWLYEIESKKAGVKHNRYLASAINLSGRQRMLSQKMTKEYLLIALKHNIPDNQLLLQQTYSLFDHTLKGLISGDQALHLQRTELAHIREQLNKILSIWMDFKVVLSDSTKAYEPYIGQRKIDRTVKINVLLLESIDKAVGMFEKEAL